MAGEVGFGQNGTMDIEAHQERKTVDTEEVWIHQFLSDTCPKRPWRFWSVPPQIQEAGESECIDCQVGIDDTKRVVFRCDRWQRQRRELEERIRGELEPDTIVSHMLQCEANWEAMKAFPHQVLLKREEEECARQPHDDRK